MRAGEGPALAALPALCALLMGCGSSAVRQPPALVSDFATAVTKQNWSAAYAFMSASYRRRVTLAKFRADMEAERSIVSANAAALSRRPVSSSTHADVTTALGDRVDFVLEDDSWRLQTQPLEPFSQDSPRAALRTFVRAVDARRYDVLLRLIPHGRAPIGVDLLRVYWEGNEGPAHRRVLDRLRANLDSPIVDLGEEAIMPLDAGPQGRGKGGGEVQFLFQEGAWKIDEND